MSLILDGTNGLSDVDGSAATPAIRGTDTNTGIFFPAADTIAFSEGGVESMRITSSGVVQAGNNAGTGEVFAQNTVKAWGVLTSAGGLYNSFGISSSSKNGTGNYQLNFSRTFSSARFGMAGAVYAASSIIAGGGESTTATQLRVYNTLGSLTDADAMFIIAGGS